MRIRTKIPVIDAVIVLTEKIGSWLERYRIRVYAAQASFFMTISAFPFLIVLLAVVGRILPENGGAIKDGIISAVPESFAPLAGTVLDEVSEKSNIRLLSVSAVTLLWSASRGIRGIGAGIRNVYGGKPEADPIKYVLRGLAYTLLWMLTVLMTLLVWVFGDTVTAHIRDGFSGVLRIFSSGAFLVVLTAVFALTFRGYSGVRTGAGTGFFSGLRGAAFAAVGWFVYSRLFEFYIGHFADYSYIYGSLASVIIVMLWLYSCMEILLIGAGVNTISKNRRKTVSS